MVGRTVTRSELRYLVGTSIGWVRAAEVLAALTANLPPTLAWPLGDVVDEFDVLSHTRGLVGAVARFAKATLILGSEPDPRTRVDAAPSAP